MVDVFPQGERGAKGLQGEKGIKGQEGPPGEQVSRYHIEIRLEKQSAFVYCMV